MRAVLKNNLIVFVLLIFGSPLLCAEELEIRKSEQITAEDRDYWAFRPIMRPEVPSTSGVGQARTTLDALLHRRLEDEGLDFSPQADRRTLIRRAYLDLVGLLPEPNAVERFLADQRPDAFERVVDQLLASHHFGERWGRHWLDVAGYVDVYGIDENASTVRRSERKWYYRDYVIDVYNEDRPFDRFLVEQLAGDEVEDWRGAESMTPEMKERLVATGFLRMVADDTDQDVLNIPPNRYQVLFNSMEMIGSSVFAMSLQCARCHSHKFAPIRHRDYFQLMALLTPGYNPDKWVKGDHRILAAVSLPEKAKIETHNAPIHQRMRDIEAQIKELHKPYADRLFYEKLGVLPPEIHGDLRATFKLTPDKRNAVQTFLFVRFQKRLTATPEEIEKILSDGDRKKTEELRRELAEVSWRLRHWERIQAFYDTGPPPETPLLIRGDYKTPGDLVEPGFLSVLCESSEASVLRDAEAPGDTSGRRLALARWITNPDTRASALVSRVLVNRVWRHLLGEGIVPTPGNFVDGARPSHPRVLEFLASEFQRNGWRVKPLIRSIMSSRAYRQASRRENSGRAFEVDPTNRLLWRARLRRVEAEVLRDCMLTAGASLDRTVGGPPVEMKLLPGDRLVVPREGQVTSTSHLRRSLYVFGRRNFGIPILRTFDQPVMATNCHRRESSAVVLQSLTLLNDDFVLEQADDFARRILHAHPLGEGDENSRRRWIDAAFEIAYSRPVSEEELNWSQEHLLGQAVAFREAGVASDEVDFRALSNFCHTLISSSNFFYVE